VEVERVDEEVVHLTVATRFLRNWLRSHYYEFVLRLSRGEWPTVERVEFRVRQPHFGIEAPKEPLRQRRGPTVVEAAPEAMPLPMPLRTGYGGFEGSPLDPRLSFTSFMVGASNRLAHAAAQEGARAAAADGASLSDGQTRAKALLKAGLGRSGQALAVSLGEDAQSVRVTVRGSMGLLTAGPVRQLGLPLVTTARATRESFVPSGSGP